MPGWGQAKITSDEDDDGGEVWWHWHAKQPSRYVWPIYLRSRPGRRCDVARLTGRQMSPYFSGRDIVVSSSHWTQLSHAICINIPTLSTNHVNQQCLSGAGPSHKHPTNDIIIANCNIILCKLRLERKNGSYCPGVRVARHLTELSLMSSYS